MTQQQLRRHTGLAAAKVIKVTVRSSDPVSRLGMIDMLEGDPQLVVLDEADCAQAAITVVAEDVVGDVTFGGLRCAGRESEADSPTRCVVVTDNFSALSVLTVIECGVATVLPRRDLGREQLVHAVLSVSRGLVKLPPSVQANLLAQLQRVQHEVLEPNGLTIHGFATRERDVLRLLAEGLGTDEIAVELSYSERTVKTVLYGLMSRHKLRTRAHAVAYAVRTGAV